MTSIVEIALKDDSELLKHELAYCLGQIGNPRANAILIEVLEDLGEHEMVRHEVKKKKKKVINRIFMPILRLLKLWVLLGHWNPYLYLKNT